MKRNNLLRSLLCLIMSVVLISSIALLTYANVNNNSGEDHSRPGSTSSKTVTSADILEYVLGEELTAAEREYLATFGYSIKYDDGIPASNEYVRVEYSAENKTLKVTAKPYSYKDVGGNDVVWTPLVAVIDEVEPITMTLDENGEYTAYFEEVVNNSDDATVQVKYTTEFGVPAGVITALATQGYNAAGPLSEKEAAYSEAKAAYEDYLEALAAYNSNLDAYRAYMKEYGTYEEQLAKYNKYLADCAKYEEASKAYVKYQSDLAAYEAALPKYAQYLSDYKEYSARLTEYNEYLTAVTPLRNQLAAIELLDVKMTDLKRSARDAINSTLVDTVLQEKDALVTGFVGAPGKVIDLAGEATKKIRVLMEDYFALETEAARYAYYSNYYTDFRDNFVNLFISLDYLYTNNAINSYIHGQDKDEKYNILLAQLYLVATALSDEPIKTVDPALVAGSSGADSYKQTTYTSNYKTADRYTVADILGSETYITDTDSATPLNVIFPATVEEPTAPAVVKEPKRPAYVAKPVEPEAVLSPEEAGITAPPEGTVKPEKPGEAPSAVAEPDQSLAVTDPAELALIEAYRNGELTDRSDMTFEDSIYVAEKVLNKRFVVEDTVMVTFYDEDWSTKLYEVEVDSGNAVYYNGDKVLEKESTAEFDYAPIWVDNGGNEVDLGCVEHTVSVYLDFAETLRSYDVIWSIDGKNVVSKLDYGSLVYGFADGLNTDKASDDTYNYEFAGWRRGDSKDVISDADFQSETVQGTVTYTAVYDAKYIAPSISGGGGKVTYDADNCTVDYTQFGDKKFKVENLISGVAENAGGLVIKSGFGELELSLSTVKSLNEGNETVETIGITSSTRTDGAYTYRVDMLSSDSVNISGHAVSVSAKCDIMDKIEDMLSTLPAEEQATQLGYIKNRLLLSYGEGADKRYVNFTLEDGVLSFDAISSVDYTFEFDKYNVTVAAPENTTITIGSAYSVGASVYVDYDLPIGIRMSRLYYIDEHGALTELDKNIFIMPYSDITLFAVVEKERYRVTFESDGNSILTGFYDYGTVLSPEAPRKPSDGEYNYVFTGWSPELLPVTGEVVYTAQFDKVPVEEVEEPFVLTIYDKAILITVLVALLIVSGITALIVRSSKRRRFF